MTHLLRVEQADVVRDGKLLLDGVSLTVRHGEHWALLGPNGAGKTTLFSLLGAIGHPTRGRVDIMGRVLGRSDIRELRSLVGHVNPRHPLTSPLRVSEVVLTGLTGSIERSPRWSPTPEQEAQADKLISMIGMSARAEAPLACTVPGRAWPHVDRSCAHARTTPAAPGRARYRPRPGGP